MNRNFSNSRSLGTEGEVNNKKATMNPNVPQDVQTTNASIVQPASGKQQRPASQPVDSHSVSRRLQAKLMSLMTCGVLGISAFPEGDNIFAWIGTIEGSLQLSMRD